MNMQVRCLTECRDLPHTVDPANAFLFDAERLDGDAAAWGGIVLRKDGELRAARLLETGVGQVFVGEAALRDAGAVERLVMRFGGARIGVYVPARRIEVGWSFDTTSNADFRVVTPSQCEPGWEILRADRTRTGVRAHWWIAEMMKRGVGSALVQVDLRDDADLNLSAGLIEEFGERIWLGPLDDAEPALDDWITYGRIAQLALAPALFVARELLCASPSAEDDVGVGSEAA